MGNISNLFNSIPGTKQDWKQDWKETSQADWKFDWDSVTGSNPGLPAPVNTVLPAISGTARIGNVLTASTGTWGGASNTYTYQWMRNGEDVDGSTASTYSLTVADLGFTMSVRVTATNASGQVEATSAVTAAIAL